MIKLFISQPMKGKTNEEILEERRRIVREVEHDFDEEVELVDSFFPDCEGDQPLALLGRSIQRMAEAETVFFARGWEEARGCRIEHACACAYDKEIIAEMSIKNDPEMQQLLDKARSRIRDLQEGREGEA